MCIALFAFIFAVSARLRHNFFLSGTFNREAEDVFFPLNLGAVPNNSTPEKTCSHVFIFLYLIKFWRLRSKGLYKATRVPFIFYSRDIVFYLINVFQIKQKVVG